MWSLLLALVLVPMSSQQTLDPLKIDFTQTQGIQANTEPVANVQWDPAFNMDEYELGPGDVLDLYGFGGRGLHLNLHVTPQYRLVVPTVGAFDIRNKKFADISKLLQQRVRSRYTEMSIELVLQKPREFKVQLQGEVTSPGTKVATPLTRLSDFLERSGGLKSTASTLLVLLQNVRLKTERKVEYQKYLLHGDLTANPFLIDGDNVIVSIEKNVAFVKGNVVRPGRIEFLQEAIKLKDAVENEFGGFLKRHLVSGQIAITRFENSRPITTYIDSEDFFSEGDGPFHYETLELKNGDQIYFPVASEKNPGASQEVVFVTGEVRAPAPIPYKPGMPLQSYIAAAGGVSTRANYEEIEVYKASGSTVSIQSSPTIEPGDTIHVPEKTFKFWQDHLTILMTFLTLVTTTIAISR